MSDYRKEIYEDIEIERQNQDILHGGPPKDWEHHPHDWCAFLIARIGKAMDDVVNEDPEAFSKHMVQVAALAVATLEYAGGYRPEGV